VLNKRQEFPNPDDGKESFTKEGWQEQRYETDFFLQRQTMHVAVPQCMLGMSVVLVHDKYLTITVSLAISPSILPVKAYESASS